MAETGWLDYPFSDENMLHYNRFGRHKDRRRKHLNLITECDGDWEPEAGGKIMRERNQTGEPLKPSGNDFYDQGWNAFVDGKPYASGTRSWRAGWLDAQEAKATQRMNSHGL